MDGNGRWARKRLLPRVAGHKRGADAVRATIRACIERGVNYLTLFAFSSENWRRPQDEVSFLMQLFVRALEDEVAKLHDNNIRFRVIGDLSRFDPGLVDLIKRAESLTAGNDRLTLTVAANYGGRWDILQALQRMVAEHPEKLGGFAENDLAPYLAMNFAPEPDLFIRTGGNSASAISCCGNSPIRSCTSPTDYGRNSTARHWTRRSNPTVGENGALAAPANNLRPARKPSRLPPGPPRNMLRQRVVTALVLVVALLSAIFLLPQNAWLLFAGVLVVVAIAEWSGLIGLHGTARAIHCAVTTVLFFGAALAGGLAGSSTAVSRLVLLILFGSGAAFWLTVAPLWLSGKWPLRAGGVGVIVGWLVVVPSRPGPGAVARG